MLLEGKKALVTGSRRSIGRGIAQALAEAGCDVGINDVERDADAETTLDLIRKAGSEAAFFEGDISNATDVEQMFGAFLDRFGRIDILVNNPYWAENRPFMEITEAIWDRTLDVCGRGIAQALSEAGCDVGINDVERDADAETTLDLIREAGREAAFFEADISNATDVERMFGAFLDRFGRIDILVNNPYWAENRPFMEITEAIWDRTLDVCLKGYFLCSQAAARNMSDRGDGGSIVSISSVHAQSVWENDTCYGTAKAGILRLTMSMAYELAPLGIRCNAILPGYMDTVHAFGQNPPARGSAPENLHGFIPTRRGGTPEDIGRAVVFLSSPHAANINGVSLPVDGGLLLTGVP